MTYRLVVVDDDEGVRRLVASTLAQRGYEVVACGSLDEARRLVAEAAPDLVLLDLGLPDGDGLELIGVLRATLVHDVPAIGISGRSSEEEILRCYAAGAVDFLTKPFTIDELVAKIRVSLARTGRAPSPPPAQAPRGLAFGRYKVLNELGRGGYGVVYLAEDRHHKTRVALKVPAPGDDAQSHARFLRETYSLACVKDPHVVRIRDLGFVEGRAFYAMDYIAGESLFDHVHRRGPCDEAEARALARGLLRALVAVAKAGLLHRDLKPSNVMLADGAIERPVLIDFGLARWEMDRGLTGAHELVGTLDFLPPEYIDGRGIDARSDLFSLGITLRWTLAGEDAFPGLRGLSLLDAIRRGPIPPPRVDLSPGFAALLASLCEVDRDRRPASAAAALDALDRVAQVPPSTARAPRPRLVAHDEAKTEVVPVSRGG
jgi:CheY-like chemotaxis protein